MLEGRDQAEMSGAYVPLLCSERLCEGRRERSHVGGGGMGGPQGAPGPSKRRGGERNPPHPLLRIPERRPERHHFIEDFVKAAVTSKRKEQCEAAQKDEYAEIAATPRSEQSQSRDRDAKIDTVCQEAREFALEKSGGHESWVRVLANWARQDGH